MQKQLSETVFGQDNAISILTSGYFQSELRSITDKSCRKPMGTYLFAGPPGVGKTFLAEQMAELLELPFLRFDMSEFPRETRSWSLSAQTSPIKATKKVR